LPGRIGIIMGDLRIDRPAAPGRLFRRSLLVAVICAGLAGVTAMAQGPIDYGALVAAPDRSDADRQTDQRRDPVKLLAFTGIVPGMHVLDMGAGAGYSTELVARAAGSTGKVYAQDDTRRDRFDARMKSPAMANVTYLVRPFDDPVPPDVNGLDVITFFFAYHDTANMVVNRAQMNGKLLAALKPGGVLILADHAAASGAGTSVTKTLHRIDEQTVKAEFEKAGFKLAAEGDFLRNAQDPRDAAVFRSPVRVDEFVLRFQRP
jgi:predicted methyltransferase